MSVVISTAWFASGWLSISLGSDGSAAAQIRALAVAMELGSAVASGVGSGVLLGSESDGSAGFELGEEKKERV